jgi:hypothetical protein
MTGHDIFQGFVVTVFVLCFRFAVNNIKTASLVWYSEFLATDQEVRARFSALPDFLNSIGSGTESIQPRDYN